MEGEAKSIEVSAPAVEEAIAKGLAELGKAEDEVEIEVLSPGSRGVLGIGAKDAVVRLSFVEPEEEAPPLEESVEQIARETLQELLTKMGVKAQVTIRPEEEIPQDEDAPPFILDVMGDDLGVLIGRQGQTLLALQYVTRLIVSREVQRWVSLVVDVEKYKARREKSLRQLAQRMAERVSFNHQPIALEPMPPHERRIIHLTLRDHPIVTTKSIGKGDQRKVTIVPKDSSGSTH
jgi:spoIIIJ-associated protein